MLDVIDLNDMRTNVLKHTWSEINSKTMMCNTWGDISWAHSTHRPWVLQVLLFDLYSLRWAFTHNYHLVIHWCHLMVYIGIWNIIYVNRVFVTFFLLLLYEIWTGFGISCATCKIYLITTLSKFLFRLILELPLDLMHPSLQVITLSLASMCMIIYMWFLDHGSITYQVNAWYVQLI